ncbi:hypothetical protein RCL_jg18929.t1 [Rhizophagus clarus]|uniref:Uncharacterized protein n=1 Tax=Rhizophagus clarus TaxID=94130 RepID=A0A8H3MAR2_9GLOM|nr:hypothetical protein RCL_jg18929.t1 [Rhizophagus clarus]
MPKRRHNKTNFTSPLLFIENKHFEVLFALINITDEALLTNHIFHQALVYHQATLDADSRSHVSFCILRSFISPLFLSYLHDIYQFETPLSTVQSGYITRCSCQSLGDGIFRWYETCNRNYYAFRRLAPYFHL